jgi:hypothetical protein
MHSWKNTKIFSTYLHHHPELEHCLPGENEIFVLSASVTSFHKPKHHGPFPADVHQLILRKARLVVLVLSGNVNCQSITKHHNT